VTAVLRRRQQGHLPAEIPPDLPEKSPRAPDSVHGVNIMPPEVCHNANSGNEQNGAAATKKTYSGKGQTYV